MMLFRLILVPFIINIDFTLFQIDYKPKCSTWSLSSTTCINVLWKYYLCILTWMLYQCTVMTYCHLGTEHFVI
jgi:hypothetical protein